MPSYTEEDLQNAIQDVLSGISIRKAASGRGVPRQTISDRLSGRTTRKESHEDQQRLSKEQETSLRKWILIQQELGVPPTHSQLRDFATRILRNAGDTQPLGKHWVEGFLSRNREVKTVKGKRINTVRFNGASTEIVKEFFRLLALPEVKEILQENRHNMDEMGLMEGQGSNGLVLGSSERKVAIVKEPGSRLWTTIIECISATSRVLTPLVIFKGKTIQQQYFPDETGFLEDWNFTASEKGWTSNNIALLWLKTIFIPQTKPAKPNQKRLLIVDGHGSHCTDDFMYECYKNNIFLLFLPPHASHVLQPLDVAVFGPLKRAYRRHIEELNGIADTTPLGKISFLRCYHKARQEAITKENIRSGWKASGLWPVNLSRPLLNPMVKKLDDRPRTPPENAPGDDDLVIVTPRSSAQLRALIATHLPELEANPIARLVLRKIGVTFDRHNTILANQDITINALMREMEELRPKKRRKVTIDLNKRFAQIPDVMKT